MPKVVLATALSRWLRDADADHAGELVFEIEAATVGEALERVFAAHPRLRGYVLDDQGVVRRHVAVFVDGHAIRDKARLAQALSAQSEIHVMQALSGG
ncbi:MAG: MoaD/ThiS family protein [Rehaibacterium terrae]|uniref:MoaD/ThiS family protein n=1 Tax=Rehaibacterium terrae TaxID=1341696 RepID=UPI00391943E1